MKPNEEISGVLNKWSPKLADTLTTLGYLGSAPLTRWMTESPIASELRSMVGGDSEKNAVDIWNKVLRLNLDVPAPALMIILEHMRRKPSAAFFELQRNGMVLSKSVANLSFRVAGSLYEDAKKSFARHDIDVAVARFHAALSEFRFAIESGLLTEPTMKIATGKYAAAVAMIGRWVSVSPEALSRALIYSKSSIALGNLQRETLTYRVELLVLYFDQTGSADSLRDAIQLLADNKGIASGSELVEAEARYRMALLPDVDFEAVLDQLELAKKSVARSRARGRRTVEEARSRVLSSMIAETESGRLVMPSRLTAIPRGIVALMATKPSLELWRTIRRVVKDLEILRCDGSVPAAVLSARFLRQLVDGPGELLQQQDLSLYVDVTKWLYENSSYDRHARWEAGAAALSAAKRSGNRNLKRDLAKRAEDIFNFLAVLDPTWPLPRIGIARVRDFRAAPSGGKAGTSSGSWREAAILALSSPNYARSNLGGRNEVFAVADARGFLSETFVFKRTTKLKAEHEASMLDLLRVEINEQHCESIFEVPRSLAIVEVPSEDDRKWVHVTQRSAGRLLSELPADEASPLLEPIVDLLAIYHRVAGEAPEGKSAWRPIKDHLKMWSKALFEPLQAEAFVVALGKSFPSDVRLVRKRDGHASNWLVDPAGRIVAIDFESVEFIPVGFDVAQLVEDNAIVPPTALGWARRMEVMRRYVDKIGSMLSDAELAAAYGWFALTRALRLGTERQAGKNLRRHAREICGMLAEFGEEETRILAKELSQALSRIDSAETKESTPSHDHRRLSTAMAHHLRHHGPANGVPVDGSGFASMDGLAAALNVDSSHLLAVAEHPGEPRFEVRDGSIRALYGHSLEVNVDVGIKVGAPISLYHGSSWSALDSIAAGGVKPMARQMVHLTNMPNEALAVGERKGAAILLSIEQSNDEQAVAEGIWVAKCIDPRKISIINPFDDEAGVTY